MIPDPAPPSSSFETPPSAAPQDEDGLSKPLDPQAVAMQGHSS
ncbi:hypothetical protein [Methylocystis echinoides]